LCRFVVLTFVLLSCLVLFINKSNKRISGAKPTNNFEVGVIEFIESFLHMQKK